MARFLIVYGTTEGHTRKICRRIRDWIEAEGHEATLVDSTEVGDELDVPGFDAYILAGSLHQAIHQKSLIHFAKEHAAELSRKPSAFLSVSLTAIGVDEDHRADAQRCIDAFIDDTGWRPSMTTPVAGALLYTKYDFLKRMLMKMIVKKEGGDTDTSRDYEYTDWTKLEAFVKEFIGYASQRLSTPV